MKAMIIQVQKCYANNKVPKAAKDRRGTKTAVRMASKLAIKNDTV
jgi:hypothetical protein